MCRESTIFLKSYHDDKSLKNKPENDKTTFDKYKKMLPVLHFTNPVIRLLLTLHNHHEKIYILKKSDNT